MTTLLRAETSSALLSELGFPLRAEYSPLTASQGPPFFAIELVAVQPGTNAIAPIPTWNSVAWNTLSLTPGAIETTGTIFASDLGYRTLASDPSGVVPYPPVLTEAFQIDRELPLGPGDAGSGYAWGTVRLANDDGRFDAIAAAWNADRRAVTIWRGTKTWDDTRGIFTDPAYGDLVAMFIGLAQPWFLAETELQVPIRDARYWVEGPVQSNQYGGTGAYDGTASLAGTLKPKLRGGTALAPVRNITPVLIDPVALIYQYNDAAGTVVNLYEGAARTITFSADTTNLYAGSTPAGQYRTDNSRGLFQLGSSPVHTITCDVTGQFPVAGVITKPGTIARYLLTEDLALPIANADTASFASADIQFPYTAGIYFHPSDAASGATAVSRVLAGFGAKLVTNRIGKLKCFVVRALAGTAAAIAQFDTTNIVTKPDGTGGLVPIALPAEVNPPPYRLRCAYAHNYTVQTSDLNTASATAAQLQFVAAPDSYGSWSDGSIQIAYARPNDPNPFGGSLLVQADAQAVAEALGALWGARRRIYDVTLPVEVGMLRDIGDVVRLVYPMDDLRAGKLGQIVGESFRSADDTIVLRVLV